MPWLRLSLVLALGVGCEFTIPTGRFACTTDENCPLDQRCGAGGRCVIDGDSGTASGPCSPNPCLNGGTCTEDGTRFTCACAAPFTGTMCETATACPEVLSAPANGSVDRTTGSIGDVATYSCDSLYYVESERTRMCQSTGAWSGTAPSCGATGGYPVWPMPGTPDHPFDYDARTETVIDRVTGLEWQHTIDAGTFTWDQAKSYCADLVLDGRSDWRLPTRIELVSIVDYGRANPAIDPSAFPSTPSAEFWSFSASSGSTGFAWSVDFSIGWTHTGDATAASKVRCVR